MESGGVHEPGFEGKHTTLSSGLKRKSLYADTFIQKGRFPISKVPNPFHYVNHKTKITITDTPLLSP